MFDSPYDFFSLVIAIAALIFARKAFNQTAALRARMDSCKASTRAADRLVNPSPGRISATASTMSKTAKVTMRAFVEEVFITGSIDEGKLDLSASTLGVQQASPAASVLSFFRDATQRRHSRIVHDAGPGFCG